MLIWQVGGQAISKQSLFREGLYHESWRLKIGSFLFFWFAMNDTSCRKCLPSLRGITAQAQEKQHTLGGKLSWVWRGTSTYQSNSHRHICSSLHMRQASPYLYYRNCLGTCQENSRGHRSTALQQFPAWLFPFVVRILAILSCFTVIKHIRGIQPTIFVFWTMGLLFPWITYKIHLKCDVWIMRAKWTSWRGQIYYMWWT